MSGHLYLDVLLSYFCVCISSQQKTQGETTLQSRPDCVNCMLAVGTTPFSQEDLHEGVLYLMAYYYALHLVYPKCVATLLSVLQTEVISDAIHGRDATSSYKKAISEWKKFIREK